MKTLKLTKNRNLQPVEIIDILKEEIPSAFFKIYPNGDIIALRFKIRIKVYSINNVIFISHKLKFGFWPIFGIYGGISSIIFVIIIGSLFQGDIISPFIFLLWELLLFIVPLFIWLGKKNSRKNETKLFMDEIFSIINKINI